MRICSAGLTLRLTNLIQHYISICYSLFKFFFSPELFIPYFVNNLHFSLTFHIADNLGIVFRRYFSLNSISPIFKYLYENQTPTSRSVDSVRCCRIAICLRTLMHPFTFLLVIFVTNTIIPTQIAQTTQSH